MKYPKADLRQITEDSYNYEVPLEQVFDGKYIMRLDQGPTASFKDFAARMMARLMARLVRRGSGSMYWWRPRETRAAPWARHSRASKASMSISCIPKKR